MIIKQNPARTGGAAGPGRLDVLANVLPISRHPSFVQSPQRHRPAPYAARISVEAYGRSRPFELSHEALAQLVAIAVELEQAEQRN